jgi:hypothetical protein
MLIYDCDAVRQQEKYQTGSRDRDILLNLLIQLFISWNPIMTEVLWKAQTQTTHKNDTA